MMGELAGAARVATGKRGGEVVVIHASPANCREIRRFSFAIGALWSENPLRPEVSTFC